MDTPDANTPQTNLPQLKKALECLLFVAYEPMTEKKMAELLEVPAATLRPLVQDLAEEFAARGFTLQQIAGGWQFLTDKAFAPLIEKLYRPKSQALSRAALETLAIIAYRQPVTRLEMEQIRQIKVDGVVNTLLEKGLIQEVGRREGAGRAILYGTTKLFLEKFGLNTLAELPPLESFFLSDETQETLLFAPKAVLPATTDNASD